MTARTWKEALRGRIEPALDREIDVFETEIELRKQGKLDEKLFAETRLRRGAYGQRYDNGRRHDGREDRTLAYPSGALTKGPATLWDAPGMQRIKIPFGRVTPEQMEALAEVAEEHADGILHVTTRQDFQLHFVHVEETPTIMRRLAAVGITTREACGNTVRNVTACQYAGVCPDEPFDVTPYAHATAYFLLGHPDTQDFGRKFKYAFSGCGQHACALAAIHDVGLIAKTRVIDGRTERGFAFYVGGGLGAVPQQAQLFDEFLPERELLPTAQAIARVFARLGEKKNRQRARLKFLLARLGLDELRRLVLEERGKLTPDPRWTAFLDDLHAGTDRPLRPAAPLSPGPRPDGFDAWLRTNTRPQPQAHYVVATVRLPLGDLSSAQLRALAAITRRFVGDAARTTAEQNIVLRWVSEADLPELYAALQQIGLAAPGAGTIVDITSCPGTDTCKLGISSSRGLSQALTGHLAARRDLDPAVAAMHIKASGCFNACGQHHVADLGFLGVSRNVGGRRVPHFQVVLGGETANNAGAYGLPIGAVPSKNVPKVVDRITERFVAERTEGESFQAFVQRYGKARVRAAIEDLIDTPRYEAAPDFYSDWGDPREYTIGDLGAGECAGEVVSPTQFGLGAAEREVFEAQLALEAGEAARGARLAFSSMVRAARALVQAVLPEVPDEPEAVVREFRARLHETQVFHDPFVGDKFAQYLFRVAEQAGGGADTVDGARQRIAEAMLFIEAAHACHARMAEGVA